MVIGKQCKNVSRENALDYVLGYTCGNDVSARDWQKEFRRQPVVPRQDVRHLLPARPVPGDTRTKSPIPTRSRFARSSTATCMQDWTTADMIFDVPTLIEFLSGSTTLLPGTVILTGTPHGVGMARTPPVFLKPGDTVTVEIEKIGELTNPVVDES